MLKEKEKRFCQCQAALGDPTEAAIRAGYPPASAEGTAQKLLLRKEIAEGVETAKRQLRQSGLLQFAVSGLRRLAFSRVNDLVRLALRADTLDDAALQKMDLFAVAELKKQKDGGYEFKFVDRIKALQALAETAQLLEDGRGADDFLRALADTAQEGDHA